MDNTIPEVPEEGYNLTPTLDVKPDLITLGVDGYCRGPDVVGLASRAGVAPRSNADICQAIRQAFEEINAALSAAFLVVPIVEQDVPAFRAMKPYNMAAALAMLEGDPVPGLAEMAELPALANVPRLSGDTCDTTPAKAKKSKNADA